MLTQLSSLLLYGDHRLLSAALLACTVVLAFRNFLSILFLPIVPVISKILTSALSLIINPRYITALTGGESFIFSKTVREIIKEHWNFGIGLGKDNMSVVLSDFAYPGVDKYIRPYSTFQSMLLCFGVIFTAFIIFTIIRLLLKNVKTALISKGKNPLCESVSIASVSSCLSVAVIALCFFITDDASAIIVFALFCGLGSSAAQCMESEYIDSNRIR